MRLSITLHGFMTQRLVGRCSTHAPLVSTEGEPREGGAHRITNCSFPWLCLNGCPFASRGCVRSHACQQGPHTEVAQ